jgi:hypothetical protein
MPEIPRRMYVSMLGQTEGDRLPLAGTNLFIEIDDDRCVGGDRNVFGGGKSGDPDIMDGVDLKLVVGPSTTDGRPVEVPQRDRAGGGDRDAPANAARASERRCPLGRAGQPPSSPARASRSRAATRF